MRSGAATLATAVTATLALSAAGEALAQCDPSVCSGAALRAAYAQKHCPGEAVAFVRRHAHRFKTIELTARGARHGGVYMCEGAARKAAGFKPLAAHRPLPDDGAPVLP